MKKSIGSLALAALCLASASSARAKDFVHFGFKFDPKTPEHQLLPIPPSFAAPLPWQVQDLRYVPEIALQEPRRPSKKPDEGTAFIDGMRQIAMDIAKVNHLNKAGTDHFVKRLLDARPDLAGLPFAMGADCRLDKTRAESLADEVGLVRTALTPPLRTSLARSPAKEFERDGYDFWKEYNSSLEAMKADSKSKPATDAKTRLSMQVAALMQMLALESPAHLEGLTRRLADIDSDDATRGLARLAIFSMDDKTRELARDRLKKRDAKVYTPILLDGLRYPWPQAAQNAGVALAQLGAKDVLPKLIAILDEPDPRAPRVVKVGTTPVVREVVRLNHHRNCLLCHAPALGDARLSVGDGDKAEPLTADITAAVPNPNAPFSRGGYMGSHPETLVRFDVTYLRQDFSLLLPVAAADPWPALQRFDFLVRTRPVSDKEVEAYRAWREYQGADYVPPHQQAALHALRAITGVDAGPRSADWRRVLKEPRTE